MSNSERSINPARVHVVVGGQFGSEAKGHVAHRIIRREAAWRGSGIGVVSVRVGGPNAGHTAVDDNGVAWPLRTVPVGAVTTGVPCVISAGSEVEMPVLIQELDALASGGWDMAGRLFIDPEVTLIDSGHHAVESAELPGDSDHAEGGSLVARIGSTGKGIGAARAARAMRTAARLADAPDWIAVLGAYGVAVRDTGELLGGLLGAGAALVLEGTQGFGLGQHAGHYPYVTSQDCRAIDVLAQAGVNPWQLDRMLGGPRWNGDRMLQVWVVVRPYPIRVAGNSGPLRGETTWDDLDLPAEITTVTHKVRRVGLWDPELVRAAVLANGGGQGGPAWDSTVRLAFTMTDQVVPGLAGMNGRSELADDEKLMTQLGEWLMLAEKSGAPVALITTGPNTGIWIQ